MKMWKGNKTDREWELSNEEIAKRFLASEYAENENRRGTDMNLVLFIANKDGLHSTWEWDEAKGSITGSPDMLQILDLIREAQKK